MKVRNLFTFAAFVLLSGTELSAQDPVIQFPAPATAAKVASAAPAAIPSAPPNAANYILGPGDKITVQALNLEELDDREAKIDLRGYINLPLAGRMHVAGMNLEEVETEVARRLKTYLQEPSVTVSIEEYHSQPVSVLGAVGTPGVLQLQGRKSLYEVLSLAGGLKPEAGNTVVITRHKEWGLLPLDKVKVDPTGEFSTAELSVKSTMGAKNPQENIIIQPNDVISVPRAELVYVIGAVKRPGGYVLNERETISVLQALSLAEGLDRFAATNKAKILRAIDNSTDRTEIALDVKSILAGKSSDTSLLPNDILFIPSSAGKAAAIRGAEAALQIGSGIAVYRR